MQHFQFLQWTRERLPSVTTFVSFVADVLPSLKELEREERVAVHDL